MYKKILYQFFCLMMLLPGVEAAGQETVAGYYEDARSLFSQGDYTSALLQIKNVLQLQPDHLPARILAGEVNLRLGKAAIAEKELSRAMALGGDQTLIVLPLARARNQTGLYKKNIETIKPSHFDKKLSADLLVELGWSWLNLGEPEKARQSFDSAFQRDPLNISAQIGRAALLLNENRLLAAEDSLRAVLARSAGHPEASFLLGKVLHAQGKYAQAAEFYRQARDARPFSLENNLAYATVLLDARHLPEARKAIDIARKQFPWSPRILYVQYLIQKESRQPDQAKVTLADASALMQKLAIKDIADDRDKLFLGYRITLENGELSRAIEYLETLRQRYPNHAGYAKSLAALYVQNDEPLKAIKLLSPLSTTFPDDVALQTRLGSAYQKARQYSRALDAYRRALELDPGNPDLLQRVGFIEFYSGKTGDAIEHYADISDKKSPVFLPVLLFSQGRLDEALQKTRLYLEKYPDSPVLLNLQASILLSQGKMTEAERYLTRLSKTRPGFRPAKLNLAKLYRLQGQYQKAMDLLESLLTQKQNSKQDIRPLFELARIQDAQQQTQAAITTLEKIRAIDRTALQPMLLLIRLYRLQNQLDIARDYARTLYSDYPDDTLAGMALARVAIARGELDSARSLLTRVAEKAGFRATQLYGIARLQELAGSLRDAVWSLTKALESEPDNRNVRYFLATLYFRQGRYQEAEQLLRVQLKKLPKDIQTMTLLGDIAFAQNRFKQAETIYRDVLKVEPRAEVYLGLSRLYRRTGQAEKARKLLQTAVKYQPDEIDLLGTLAMLETAAGHDKTAVKLLERVLKIAPGHVLALNNLANLYLDSDRDKALALAKKAYAGDPENVDVIDTYAWLLTLTGQPEQALPLLREANARDAGFVPVRIHLGKTLMSLGREAEAGEIFQKILEAASASDRPKLQQQIDEVLR